MAQINDLILEIQNQLKAFDSMDLASALFHCEVTHPAYKPMSKKNSRPIRRSSRGTGKPFLGKSDELTAQENLLSFAFHNARVGSSTKTIDGHIHAIYHFHFGPELNRSYALMDLSNMLEIVSDCLQKSGVILNDRLIKSYDGTRAFQGPKTKLEVFLLAFTENLRKP